MSLKARPQYLYDPAYITPELQTAEELFQKRWLPEHEVPGDLTLFHYTNLPGMQGILERRNLWLSHFTSFSDPNEVEYGKQLVIGILEDFIRRENAQPIRDFLTGILPFVKSFGTIQHHPFIVCFCESGNLLSQWRGYADKGYGYSLGFKISEYTRFVARADKLGSGKVPFFRKVIYSPALQKELVKEFLTTMGNAAKNVHDRNPANASIMGVQAANQLLDMLLCFKHPAFEEEREWRWFRLTPTSSDPDGVQFRDVSGQLVPYRPTCLFDKVKGEKPTFPLCSITFGPSLIRGRARAAVELLVQNLSRNGSPIKLKSIIQIIEPGFSLK